MRVIVCGDRDWSDPRLIYQRLARLRQEARSDVTVVTGGSSGGVDAIADNLSRFLGFATEAFPAESEQGPAAGPTRSQKMLDAGADLVIAFQSDVTQGEGTKDIVEKAQQAGVAIEIIRGVKEE